VGGAAEFIPYMWAVEILGTLYTECAARSLLFTKH